MATKPDTSAWVEPTDQATKSGHGRWARPRSPYDIFMEEQGIPIYRGIGVKNSRDLPLQPWKRMGGKGTFIQLYGTEGKWGMYVVEVPAAGALNVEKHLYEEVMFVLEGRGSTEVWNEGSSKKSAFEWQKGSLFSIPVNTSHRIINATSSPALLLVGTTAPPVLNLFQNQDFVFNNDYKFRDRFDESADYYKPSEEIEPDPVRGLAMRKTNIIPDIVNCELPSDNRRSPGYRRIEPFMSGNKFYLWIGQHEQGRYSKAHAHGSAAVLICLTGRGYTYTWPRSLGMHPWEDGHADQVRRQDYEPGGMVTAAPMTGDWFHQHFGISTTDFRLTAWFGPHAPGREPGVPGEEDTDRGAIDVTEGGSAIPYHLEDPYLRKEFEEALRADGVKSRMDPAFYAPR